MRAGTSPLRARPRAVAWAIGAAVLVLSGGGWLAIERHARQAARVAARLAEERIAPASQAAPGVVLPASLRVDIVDGGFEPVGLVQAARSAPLGVRLGRVPHASVLREPEYAGEEPWYGALELGRPRRTFAFALDAGEDGAWRMWFDANANGDLADDGPPRANQGSGDGRPGAFAVELAVAWSVLDAEAPFRSPFRIWFFSNASGWERGRRASHYSRTQLRGRVSIDGVPYAAWLVERGGNDADFTNDGVGVDVDRDGVLDAGEWLGGPHDPAAVTVRW